MIETGFLVKTDKLSIAGREHGFNLCVWWNTKNDAAVSVGIEGEMTDNKYVVVCNCTIAAKTIPKSVIPYIAV